MIPAGHTDLVLPAIGEEWGFCGVADGIPAARIPGVAWNANRIARASEYGMFLALGLSALDRV
jgi:cell division protein FtsW (lipid II flippase)